MDSFKKIQFNSIQFNSICGRRERNHGEIQRVWGQLHILLHDLDGLFEEGGIGRDGPMIHGGLPPPVELYEVVVRIVCDEAYEVQIGIVRDGGLSLQSGVCVFQGDFLAGLQLGRALLGGFFAPVLEEPVEDGAFAQLDCLYVVCDGVQQSDCPAGVGNRLLDEIHVALGSALFVLLLNSSRTLVVIA